MIHKSSFADTNPNVTLDLIETLNNALKQLLLNLNE